MPWVSGLSINPEPAGMILDGIKTWEIRGTYTDKREVIAIIPNGTGKIVGEARIVDSFRVDEQILMDNADKHHCGDIWRRYAEPFAWVLENAKRYAPDEQYTVKKPRGAQGFVTLLGRGIVSRNDHVL